MKNDKPKSESKLKRAVAQKRGKVLDELRNVKNKATEKIKKSKRDRQDKKSAKGKNTVSINRLELMITVVNRNKAEFFADLIQSFSVNMQLLAGAQGTANARMRELFGFADNDKAVIFSVVQESKRKEILSVLEEKFRTVKGGKGIALVVPFASMIGTAAFGFLSDNRDSVKESERNNEGSKK